MRKLWARRIALLTGGLVLLLSAAFAAVLNPDAADTEESPMAAAADAGATPKPTGRKVFEDQGCMQCHSIAGEGSPRSPLDGVGSRLPADEIRQYVIADPEVEDDLSPRVVKAKRAYTDLPAAELQALVDYLASLKD